MPLYAGLMAYGIAMPTPPHTLTAAAEEARASMRRLAAERDRERIAASLVTEHGHPKIVPHDGPLVPAAAKRTREHAESHGFETLVIETATGCRVEGLHRGRREGFRAFWDRGKTTGGTWHAGPRDMYRVIDISSRPIGVDQKAKTTKLNHRRDEKDRYRLVLTASPRGVRANITEIEKKIGAKPAKGKKP